MANLQPFLKSCAELQPGVNIKNIIIALIERLASYSQRNDGNVNLSVVLEDGKEQEVQLFEVFSDQVAAITQVGGGWQHYLLLLHRWVSKKATFFEGNTLNFDLTCVTIIFFTYFSISLQNRVDMPPEDTLSLQLALLKLAQRCHPDKLNYVDRVLAHTDKICADIHQNR